MKNVGPVSWCRVWNDLFWSLWPPISNTQNLQPFLAVPLSDNMDGPGEGAASTNFFHGAASCQSRGMEISHEGVYNVYPWLKFQKTKFRSIFVMKATPVGQINIYLETWKSPQIVGKGKPSSKFQTFIVVSQLLGSSNCYIEEGIFSRILKVLTVSTVSIWKPMDFVSSWKALKSDGGFLWASFHTLCAYDNTFQHDRFHGCFCWAS